MYYFFEPSLQPSYYPSHFADEESGEQSLGNFFKSAQLIIGINLSSLTQEFDS